MKKQASRLGEDTGKQGMGSADGFKDTGIGRIPVEWDVKAIGNVVKVVGGQ